MKKIILLVTCLFLLVGCSDNKENTSNQEKITSEVKYFSSQIGEIFNKLNNITLENYEIVSEKISMEQSGGAEETQGQPGKESSGGEKSEGEGSSQSRW